MSLLIKGLFEQFYVMLKKLILGISNICLWLFFSHAMILERKSSLINRLIQALIKRLENYATFRKYRLFLDDNSFIYSPFKNVQISSIVERSGSEEHNIIPS